MRLLAHLQRVEHVVDIENKVCGCCGSALHVIGENVSGRLDVVPTAFRVLVTRRPRYGCRECEPAPVQTPAPAHIIDGGLLSEALAAQMLVPNTPTTCPYTARRTSTPARASNSTVRRWPTGPGGRRGGCDRCATICSTCSSARASCSPTKRWRRCLTRNEATPSAVSYGPTRATTDHGPAATRLQLPTVTRPTEKLVLSSSEGPSSLSNISPASVACCRSTPIPLPQVRGRRRRASCLLLGTRASSLL